MQGFRAPIISTRQIIFSLLLPPYREFKPPVSFSLCLYKTKTFFKFQRKPLLILFFNEPRLEGVKTFPIYFCSHGWRKKMYFDLNYIYWHSGWFFFSFLFLSVGSWASWRLTRTKLFQASFFLLSFSCHRLGYFNGFS